MHLLVLLYQTFYLLDTCLKLVKIPETFEGSLKGSYAIAHLNYSHMNDVANGETKLIVDTHNTQLAKFSDNS